MLAIAASTIFVACNKGEEKKTETASNNSNRKELQCPFEYISTIDSAGYYHTKGLEAAYTGLANGVSNNNINPTSLSSVNSSLNSILGTFYGTVSIKGGLINLDTANIYSSTSIANALNDYNFIFDASQPYARLWTQRVNGMIPSAIIPSLNTLSQIILDSTKNISQTITEMEVLRDQISCSNMTEEEKGILFTALSVGESSLTYWDSNIDSWNALLGSSSSLRFGKITQDDKSKAVKRVGATDVAGAVAGAVGSGIGALFGPVGAAVVFSAIIGGGIGASAGAVVYEYIMRK